ncbi:MAG TPA: GHMP kinase [Anaerolineae bacterium]|nr:GHMP kinase [Anaerolineae bacterium]HPL30230.1 GHMP kinase [Anaerolineae bacterium]
MIVVQTPLRVSFLGGGTDFQQFYRREEGCVLSTAIDKYIYVIIKRRFDARVRIAYTRTELVDRLDDVQHDLVREAMRLAGIDRQVELATMGDIPSEGSGLGSSSTVTVGCLNALYTYRGEAHTAADLAEQACRIEIGTLRRPIGKQDQYIAAYGGLRFIRFHEDNAVTVERVALDADTERRLARSLMLFYTGMTRDAATILREQVAHTRSHVSVLRGLKALAWEGRGCLERGDPDALGRLMHEGWLLKRCLASTITNPAIDALYERAHRAGALGGKISGAGGGGFLLLYVPVERQDAVRRALKGLAELPCALEPDGSKVILNIRR